jgi:hypothetical protein
MTQYPWRVRTGTALSQLINAALFAGHPNVSLSTRAFYDQDKSRFWKLIRITADAIFGQYHCEVSCEEDIIFARDVLDQMQ